LAISFLSDTNATHHVPQPSAVKAADVSGHRVACLAGASADTAGNPDTEAVWTAMQEAAAGKPLNMQRLVVPLTTADQAGSYLSGLAAQHCDLIVSIGPDFASAIPIVTRSSPHTQFIAVLQAGQTAPPGVAAATGTSAEKARAVRERVSELVNA
jgi:hypothetical protein